MSGTFNAAWHKRALAGDAGAVAQLADCALQPLFAFCYYRVGGRRHLCEEVVQETMLRAIRDLDRYQPDRASGEVFGWLTGLARNEIRRVLSREPSLISLEELWMKLDTELSSVFSRLDSEPIAGGVLDREETREMVSATMAQLPPTYREALEAKYVSGKSIRDLASLWRVSESAVESRLARARRAFRAAFEALTRGLAGEVETSFV